MGHLNQFRVPHFLWEYSMKPKQFSLTEGILADQSGQDTIEYILVAMMILGVAAVLLNVLTPLMRQKAALIQTSWPKRSP